MTRYLRTAILGVCLGLGALGRSPMLFSRLSSDGRSQRPMEAAGSRDGVPAWSLVTAYPERNGNFVVLY